MGLTYRPIYRAQFCDKNLIQTAVVFEKLMDELLPIPVVKAIKLAGIDSIPVNLSYKADGEYKMQQINGSECSFKIIAENGFELKSLYAKNETEFRVIMSGGFNWNGFVIPDSCSEPFLYENYEVEIRATDRIGILKDIPYMNGGLNYTGFSNDITTLNRVLANTGLSLDLLCAINTYESSMNPAVDPLLQMYPDNAGYADADRLAYSCEDVLRSILSRWSAQLHQVNGKWRIINALEKTRGNVPARLFSPSGVLISSTVIVSEVHAGGIERDIRPVGTSWLSPALAQSTAYYKYGYPSNELKNGDFQEWPLPQVLPTGWELIIYSGTLTAARRNATYDPADLYVEIFGNGKGAFRNIQPVQVRAGEFVDISADIFSPQAFAMSGGNRNLGILIYNDLGLYFTASGWTTQPGTYVISYSPQDMRNQQTPKFRVDATNNDYGLYIGFQQVDANNGTQWATNVNNVSVKPAVASGQAKPSVGVFTRHLLLSEQSKKRDPILILHGDELNNRRTSKVRINNIEPTAAYKWKRANYVEEVPILTIIADTELTMHQQPYNIFEATFFGAGNIGVDDILVVDDLEGKYNFLYGDFDLLGGKHKLTLAENTNKKLLSGADTAGSGVFIEDYGAVEGKAVQGLGSVGNPNTGGSGGGSGTIIDPNAFIRNQSEYQTSAEFNILRGVFGLEVTSPNFIGHLTGTADNSLKWASLGANFSSVLNSVPYSILGESSGVAGAYSLAAMRMFFDMPVGGDTLQSVTNRGAVTPSIITAPRFIAGTGNKTVIGGEVYSKPAIYGLNSTNGVQDLLINPEGGNLGIRTMNPLAALDVNGNIKWGYGAYGAGTLFNDATYGSVLTGVVGGAYDFSLINGNGSLVMAVSTLTSNVLMSGSMSSQSYISGATGSGWAIDQHGNAEVDSLTVRKALNVTTLNIREITGTGGSFAVTNTFLISEVFDGGSYFALYFDTENGNIGNQLRAEDVIRCQVWDGSGLKYYTGVVNNAGANFIRIDKPTMTGTGVPAKGDKLFQFGNTTDTGRQGLIYMTNSDTGAPYLDILDGINSPDLTGKTKVRLGKLNSLTVPIWGALAGYGMYADNVYLTNGSFSGTVNVTGGNAATQTFASDQASAAYNNSVAITNALQGSLGSLAYDSVVEAAKLGSTVIQGGYILTSLLKANEIVVTGGGALSSSLGDLAFLSVVESAKLGSTVIQGGYILTSLLKANEIQALVVTADYINALSIDASAIKTGKLTADRIDVDTLVVRNLKTFDSGRRLEITGSANNLTFYGINSIDSSAYSALVLADNVDSSSALGQSLAGIRCTAPVTSATAYMSANGVFANGGGLKFLPTTSGRTTNASVVAINFNKNSDANGYSAAIAAISDTGSGSSVAFAAYFSGDVYMATGRIILSAGSNFVVNGSAGVTQNLTAGGANLSFRNGIFIGNW